jgi:hypothetical protein
VRDRVDFANVAEKLVAEPFAARGAADEASDIDEFELGRDDLGRFRETRRDIEPLIRYRDPPDIGFDRAERVIRRVRRGGCGQGVEKGGFADIRQPDDPTTETHGITSGHSSKAEPHAAAALHRELARPQMDPVMYGDDAR